MQTRHLQEIEVQVVRPRDVALNAVVQADAETVERVRVLQTLVDLDVIGRESPVGRAGPVHEGAGPHVVAASGAGCEDECTHVGRTVSNAASRQFHRANATPFRLPVGKSSSSQTPRWHFLCVYLVFTSAERRRPDFNID